MKIVSIFADKLFAFHYKDEVDNEYDRLMDLWKNELVVSDFLKANRRDIKKGKSIEQTTREIFEDALSMDERLDEITTSNDKSLSHFFKPLHNQEYKARILSFQKGRETLLRLYAIRIDNETFVITGGAIKLPNHHLMEDREHTQIELNKIKFARDFLATESITDEESFFEFLNEN